MKPQAIYLIRHGESVGNVDQAVYRTVPDWRIELTEKGREQACKAAWELYKDVEEVEKKFRLSSIFWEYILIKGPKVKVYSSPWTRARQTAEQITGLFGGDVYEDPRIREQEWGNYEEEHNRLKIEKERRKYGTFFYRMPDGESGADVFDRVTTFIDTMHRNFEKKDFPVAAVIVSHGLTIKALLTRWFHWKIEDFDSYKTPKNCELLKMELGKDQKYTLVTPLRRRASCN